jgi:hypothetical protein
MIYRLDVRLRAASVVLWLTAAAGVRAGGEPLWNGAWLTDTQTPACEWIDALAAAVQANRPAIVLHTGDTRFEWANRCAWDAVMRMFRSENPPHEFHLAPGNHDLRNGVLKVHLRRAATLGRYRLDTGRKLAGRGYYHNRVTEEAFGPLWPRWNPCVVSHPAWQVTANERPEDWRVPVIPYRYVFTRGGIRFIVCDCFPTEDQVQWVRELITKPDQASVTVLIQHKHEVDALAEYFDGIEGRHTVKLVLTGDHHNYQREERHGVTFITGAGLAKGPEGENDAMTLWVYRDRLRLDRYVLPPGGTLPAVRGPTAIWSAEGTFAAYDPPALPAEPDTIRGAEPAEDEKPAVSSAGEHARTIGPNLLFNGDFDNHVWYERYRGWSPSGWYQWFTRGGHAPEHAVGRPPSPPHPAHSGREYVRIHMWAHAWRGGILQNVAGVEPCHWYRLTAFGFFQPAGAPAPRERIGINPRGTLAAQFSVDVTKHPAPKYDEGVGDDPTTPVFEGFDIAEGTVWSPYRDYTRWGKFEVAAEACAATITAVLYCAPEQRPAEKPIYEMNWDSASLVEIPWPTPRLAPEAAVFAPDPRLRDIRVTLQPSFRTVQVTWGSTVPAGAAQVCYRFMDSEAVTHTKLGAAEAPSPIAVADFPFMSPVMYERAARRHWITIEDVTVPETAVELQVIALSRVCIQGTCTTLCSTVVRRQVR